MTHEFMKLYGARMADAGYAIIPIAAGQKWPGEYSNGRWWPLKGWEVNAHARPHELLIENVWANWPGAGIGICCGGVTRVIGIDIDILDAELAGAVRRKIEEALGETPLVRVGQAPKVLLVYRTTEPMQKLSFQPIEVLAQGQQFVAYGVHPKTGQPYQWPQESPTETTLDSLPEVTPEAVRAAVEAAYALVPEELRPKRLQSSDGGQHATGDSTRATPEAIREALAHIPNPDLPWDDWKKVLMATFAASHGDEGAYFDFLDWSRKSAKHNDTSTRKEWTSCRASPPRSLGFGTLWHLATQSGWVPSAGLAFNVEKDVSDVDISGFDDLPVENPPAIPQVPRAERPTIRQKLETAPPEERAVLLASVGLGEAGGMLFPVADVGSLSPQDFVEAALATPYEDTSNLFRLEEPQALQLTQDEIEHGTLPPEFIKQFPQQWLYTSSLIGQMAAWIEASCPISHRVFALMAAFTAFGSLVGRQYVTASGLRPNLACVIIAGTGSGKEGPRSAVSRMFLAAGAEKYIGPRGGFSSGSGVVQGLLDQPNMWLAVDEFGKKIAAYGAGRIDQNQREMIALFLESLVNDYIGGKGYANSKENPTKNIVLPNLNIFGSSQLEEITNALSSAATADGLIQRFLFVPTFVEYVPIKRGYEQPPVPQVLIDSIKWIMEDNMNMGGEFAINDDATMHPSTRLVQITSQAQELFYNLDERRVEMGRAGRVMWVRSAAMAMKIAMLEAIARNPVSPVIDVELLNDARALVDWFTLYAETYVRERIADSYEERNLKKVKQIIASAGSAGIQHSALLRRAQAIGSKPLAEIIARLRDSEQIYIDHTKPERGPPGAVYRLRPSQSLFVN